MIITARVYGYVKTKDCYAVLIDRLWPRGVSKDKAPWDEWLREVAPGNELRKWYGHDPEKWQEFRERYSKELAGKTAELDRLRQLEGQYKTVALLYASREEEYNNATVIKEYLSGKEG